MTANIVAILNLTPDSFSDGQERTKAQIHERILSLIEQWADIIDVGAESTAPGSQAVSTQEELARLTPFFALLQEHRYAIPFSVDTTKAAIAQVGIDAWVRYINDVSWGRADQDMLPTVAKYHKAWKDISYILMYSKNNSWRADHKARQNDTPIEQKAHSFFARQLDLAHILWVRRDNIIIDPWMWTFVSTDPLDSVRLLQHIPTFIQDFWLPIFVGSSRKWFLAKISPDKGPLDRIGGSLASSRYALQQGASYIRVHDVRAMKQFMEVSAKLSTSQKLFK